MGTAVWLSSEPISTALIYSSYGINGGRRSSPIRPHHSGLRMSGSSPIRPHHSGLRMSGGCLSSRSRLLRRPNCREQSEEAAESESSSSNGALEDWVSSSSASPYRILGINPSSCSPPQLKAAFRARVKEFHPDVCKDTRNSDAIIRRVIQAYEILSKSHKYESTERACLDPFEEPECEAYDIFVNEVLCVGKGDIGLFGCFYSCCPYSCVKRAPHAFSFSSEYYTARAISQGHGDDYVVQLAVGQCPRRCIHYVTPSQRVILEDLLESVLTAPYDLGEAALLDSLISKATLENNRFQKPKVREPEVSTEYVDWY